VPLDGLSSLRTALRMLHMEFGVPHVVVSSIPYRVWLAGNLPPSLQTSVDNASSEQLVCICSSRADAEQSAAPSVVHAQTVALIPGYFSGVGDLFSALVLAHFDPPSPSLNSRAPSPVLRSLSASPISDGPSSLSSELYSTSTPLSRAAALALSKTHGVLQRTQAYYESLPEEEQLPTDEELDREDPERKVARMRGRELRLVQSLDIITGSGEVSRMVMWGGFWSA
jgi:pyridoxine kinase